MPSYAHLSIIRSHSCHHCELSTVFPYAIFSPLYLLPKLSSFSLSVSGHLRKLSSYPKVRHVC